MDTMVTPVTASETYLQGNKRRKYLTVIDNYPMSQCMDSMCLSYPFLKNTDQPVTNLGSLVNSRTANSIKKKAIAPSAKLKFSM